MYHRILHCHTSAVTRDCMAGLRWLAGWESASAARMSVESIASDLVRHDTDARRCFMVWICGPACSCSLSVVLRDVSPSCRPSDHAEDAQPQGPSVRVTELSLQEPHAATWLCAGHDCPSRGIDRAHMPAWARTSSPRSPRGSLFHWAKSVCPMSMETSLQRLSLLTG